MSPVVMKTDFCSLLQITGLVCDFCYWSSSVDWEYACYSVDIVVDLSLWLRWIVHVLRLVHVVDQELVLGCRIGYAWLALWWGLIDCTRIRHLQGLVRATRLFPGLCWTWGYWNLPTGSVLCIELSNWIKRNTERGANMNFGAYLVCCVLLSKGNLASPVCLTFQCNLWIWCIKLLIEFKL